MGNIKEWSNIFDLLHSAEFFSAELYDDEKEEHEEERVRIEAGMYPRQRLRGESAAFFEKQNKGYGYLQGDVMHERMIEQAETERLIAYEMEAGHDRLLLNNAKETLFFAEEVMREAVFAVLENKEKHFAPDAAMSINGDIVKKEINEAESIKFVGKKKIDSILSAIGEGYIQRSGNVKIEVTNNNTIEKESDIESISDKLTQRLYEMMSRGADGLY